MKRTWLRPVSKKRSAGTGERAKVRNAVFERDGWRCQLAAKTEPDSCRGHLTYHHRRKASSGGAYIVANGLTLCEAHNQAVEDHPQLARNLHGSWLVVREGDPEWDELGERAAREAS